MITDMNDFWESERNLREFIDRTRNSSGLSLVIVRQSGSIVHKEKCQTYERIETNESKVDVVWKEADEINFPYYTTYSNKYQSFSSQGELLFIRGVNKSGERIEIEIQK